MQTVILLVLPCSCTLCCCLKKDLVNLVSAQNRLCFVAMEKQVKNPHKRSPDILRNGKQETFVLITAVSPRQNLICLEAVKLNSFLYFPSILLIVKNYPSTKPLCIAQTSTVVGFYGNSDLQDTEM